MGASAKILDAKYGNTPYILLACSLKNTGLSYWKVRIVVIKLAIILLTETKKIVEKVSIAAVKMTLFLLAVHSGVAF